MSKEKDISVGHDLVQTLVKPTTFLWLPEFLLELLVRIDVLRCKKCPIHQMSSKHHNSKAYKQGAPKSNSM